MGKKELFCALGTLMDLIEYGEKYQAMPSCVDLAFQREFESIMKSLKAPSEKQARERITGEWKDRKGSRRKKPR
jgi:hypothetical protein